MTKNDFQTKEAKINQLLQDISLAFGMSSGFFDLSGHQLGCCGFESRSNFCRFIHFYDTTQICKQSYLQGFSACLAKDEPLVYFCPFGLVNITFPMVQQDQKPYFVTTGPFLYRNPDDQMISNILDLNFLLKPRAREIRQHLGEITVKSEAQVHSMMTVIKNALRGTTLLLTEGEAPPTKKEENVSDEIRLWLNANPCQKDTEGFQMRLKEIFPQEAKQEEYLKEDVEAFLKEVSAGVFQTNDFDLMLYRSINYIEFLMELIKNSGLSLEQMFNPNAIDIEKIKNAKSRQTLESCIAQSNKIFLNSYYAGKEVYNKDVIFRSMHYIRTHFNDISLGDVAEYVSLNPTYFSNLFKKATGQSYSVYLNKIRIEEGKRLLMENQNLSEIAQKVGFSDQSYFTNVFKKIEGVSPYRWKQEQDAKGVVF